MPISTSNSRPAGEPHTPLKTSHPMTPRLGVVLLPLFVAGCGLPPAVTIASLAIDAISLAVSEKTVADHAISQIAQKDCAMWRGFTGEALCIDEDTTIAVAAAEEPPTAGGAESGAPLNAENPSSGDLVAFTTASGPAEQELMDLDMLGAESGLLGPVEPELADFTTASAPAEETVPPFVEPPTAVTAAVGMPETVDDAQPAALADRPAPGQEWVSAAMARPGLYYVIGTSSRWTTAARLAARHGTLEPSVVTATLDGRRVFRVVIGPFGPSEQKDVRLLIRRAAIYDAWAIRMDPADWSVAKSAGTAKNHMHSVAQLREPSGS